MVNLPAGVDYNKSMGKLILLWFSTLNFGAGGERYSIKSKIRHLMK